MYRVQNRNLAKLIIGQMLCYIGGPLILALWSCRLSIAPNVIVVYIPQLTTPDPRSIDSWSVFIPMDLGSVLSSQ